MGACINTDVRAADHRRGGRGSFARVQAFLASVERPHLEQRVPQGAGRFYSSMLGTAQHLRYKITLNILYHEMDLAFDDMYCTYG